MAASEMELLVLVFVGLCRGIVNWQMAVFYPPLECCCVCGCCATGLIGLVENQCAVAV